MNEEDRDTTEGKVVKELSGEAAPPKKKLWKKIALLLVVVVLLLCLAGFFYINHLEDSKSYIDIIVISCQDNLRMIDAAIYSYNAEHGVFPESIDELVPNYLKEVPECPYGGYYYIDTSQTPPRAVCSEGHTY
jgi:hypothetical protein